MSLAVPSTPWEWPIVGPCAPHEAALVVIDMQGDFVDPRGWFASLGVDVSPIRAILPTLQRVLEAARRVTGLRIVHTRQGNAPDLSDLPPPKQEQGARTDRPIGHAGPLGRGLIRGEAGWRIVSELSPLPSERVVDKPGFSAFVGTDLDDWLRRRGIRALILTGVTSNVCVLATLYQAVDRGYDCLVVEDAVAGATPEATRVLTDLVRYQQGLFGGVASAADVIAAFERARTPEAS